MVFYRWSDFDFRNARGVRAPGVGSGTALAPANSSARADCSLAPVGATASHAAAPFHAGDRRVGSDSSTAAGSC